MENGKTPSNMAELPGNLPEHQNVAHRQDTEGSGHLMHIESASYPKPPPFTAETDTALDMNLKTGGKVIQ